MNAQTPPLHFRDEAAQKLDAAFDEQFGGGAPEVSTGGVCCTPTASGQACC